MNEKMQFLGAGVAMIGTIGVGLGQGITGAKLLDAIARNPDTLPQLRPNYILGVALAESSSLYCFVIAILLIFVAQ